ncbi:hypothetical protein AFLA_006405 [Aspergillus flavus NRRL3357]|nr:hypothetical protein AFLA_006405 [Aspergillus flavus NRRL3357]
MLKSAGGERFASAVDALTSAVLAGFPCFPFAFGITVLVVTFGRYQKTTPDFSAELLRVLCDCVLTMRIWRPRKAKCTFGDRTGRKRGESNLTGRERCHY